jgi:esterase/lipase
MEGMIMMDETVIYIFFYGLFVFVIGVIIVCLPSEIKLRNKILKGIMNFDSDKNVNFKDVKENKVDYEKTIKEQQDMIKQQQEMINKLINK